MLYNEIETFDLGEIETVKQSKMAVMEREGKLTLFKPKGSKDLKIKGYYVTSNGFLDEK